MDLYSLNKQLVIQLPDIKNFEDSISLFNEFSRTKSNKYYMLLNKEISYYTVFERSLGLIEPIGEAAIDCLKNIGSSIKSIQKSEDESSIECWVIPNDSSEPIVLYFFPYDYGMCPVGV